MKIFLVGITGSGKSTLGKKLADELECRFVDSDEWIEVHEGKTISEIFQQNGESYFRQLESEFIQYTESLNNVIIATGAGLPCFNDHMEQLNRMGTTIWIDVDESILTERLSTDATPRPKLKEFGSIKEAVHSLLEQRKPFYQKAKLHIKNPTVKSLLRIAKDGMD